VFEDALANFDTASDTGSDTASEFFLAKINQDHRELKCHERPGIIGDSEGAEPANENASDGDVWI
jgi:hypothetical protein